MEDDCQIFKEILDNIQDGVYLLNGDRQITYWNKGALSLTGYSQAEVLGRCCADNILMHVDNDGHMLCKLDCPAAKTLADGCVRTAEVYLHHKDGHRLPVSIRVAPMRDARGAITGVVEIFADNSSKLALRQRLVDLQKLSMHDPLTNLANRRAVELNLKARLEEAQRYGMSFGVMFIDIDFFKIFNDKYGHDVGDEVLKMVARTLSNAMRAFDLAGRWGGEEFLVTVVNVDQTALANTAERIRRLVEHSSLTTADGSLSVTVSIGAVLSLAGDTIDSLLKKADQLMYRSKMDGRNRISV